MRKVIEAEIAECKQYLTVKGEDQTDLSFYEGRILALEWVLKQLEEKAGE